MAVDRLVLSVSSADAQTQQVDGQFVELTDGQPVRLRPWRIRYSTPAQLDAMAANAGLRCAARYEDADRTPFGDDSGRHVTMYDVASGRRPDT